MEVKHVQAIQSHHADRLLRLEKRQADDAALKSVWAAPFPSVLSGTPQQGPVPNQSNDVFDDFDDEQEQNLLGALHLDADEEPVRRGASRANSVRFDVSATQGSNWAHNSRNSGDFGLIRLGSGLGSHPMGERSLSHKSDGRHSSAGHSVHSAPSGRTSSLGLDTNFMIGGQGDDSPIDIPHPPPGLFILGSVPSIIRCWLNTHFSHDALLYAAICTGSQRSMVDYTLIKELGMHEQIQKDNTGRHIINLAVYLPEALIAQPVSRSSSPTGQLPVLSVDFEVFGFGRTKPDRKSIRVFLGSDALRAHNADILFSQNLMTLYGNDRNKYSVSFVRPEDDNAFKNLGTTNVPPEKNELKATAAPFMPTELKSKVGASEATKSLSASDTDQSKAPQSASTTEPQSPFASAAFPSYSEILDGKTVEDESLSKAPETNQSVVSESSEPVTLADIARRESAAGIWGSWRQNSISGPTNGALESNEHTYSRPIRSGRGMKVLKPSKSVAVASNSSRSSSAARTGASYEPAAPPRLSGDMRRKSYASGTENVPSQPLRWERGMSESKRVVSDEQKAPKIATVPRSTNPIGGASAFSWMTSANSKKGTTATE
ncbi:hypothetical protein BP6252_12822 [Coleophoma cylindrospora]|uniref:Ubiquitin carboxyl-terminal hydrolase 19 n=1 Tax=Coleophoma cylindrospora TaxID=1849047 RepID=A0A3D8QD03_9HELO|nr:hypothetical protein BP6252_12822 [Coleophoma cylindrospora]